MKPLVLHHQVPAYTGRRLRWPEGLPHLPSRALLCATLATVAALSACGGGESDEDAHKDTTPPACEQQPELCK